MKSLIKSAWLIMGLAATLGTVSPQARGAAVPAFSDFSPGDVSTAGLDGNLRLVFDIYSGVTLTSSTYTVTAPFLGQNIWVVSPTGTVVAAGVVSIPSSIGSAGNSYVQGQADGNTTVLFRFPNNSLGVWTYSKTGAVIASALYGPFTGTFISNVKRQEATGKFLVEWASASGATDLTFSAWTINEYGGVDTAAGPFGPFANTSLQSITLLNNGNQVWVWASSGTSTTGGVTTAVWSVAPGGRFLSANTYGPY
jgi:hypothetical protein